MTAALVCPPPIDHLRGPMLPSPLEEDNFEGCFAIARVNGAIRLVQISSATPASALTTLDVKIFRHEFIHIFRFLEFRTVHPADLQIVERIPARAVALDEDDGGDSVSLARDVLARLSRLTKGGSFGGSSRPTTGAYGHARYPSVGIASPPVYSRRVAYARPTTRLG
ncbi:hypothetical protein MIND_01224500 [Mycena indigotica]|uniref:Uncharacterized protein n=1 Tax=Mycena indigotica TaxID=2126181 RepID=A0A8H6S3F6_9AGAR|nr:uncharacterized protein MIND_01224500 [Mycena indigotica]KAF7291988.1 hypothetical protein MIND_01224500 [Mycena indigotica]